MIRNYFGLKETPFTKYVPTANLYRSQAWQELSARLDHIVKSRGLGVITGEVGAGKSTAVRALSDRLDPIRYPFIYIADSALEPRSFYRGALPVRGHTRPTTRETPVASSTASSWTPTKTKANNPCWSLTKPTCSLRPCSRK